MRGRAWFRLRGCWLGSSGAALALCSPRRLIARRTRHAGLASALHRAGLCHVCLRRHWGASGHTFRCRFQRLSHPDHIGWIDIVQACERAVVHPQTKGHCVERISRFDHVVRPGSQLGPIIRTISVCLAHLRRDIHRRHGLVFNDRGWRIGAANKQHQAYH